MKSIDRNGILDNLDRMLVSLERIRKSIEATQPKPKPNQHDTNTKDRQTA